MRKNNQIGRILIKCGADKKVFLSDVYKKHTQAKKHRLDVPQFGRSMVEMLGVLAIIGVLSVGAIAGYSKAMLKYKLNKQSEQLNQIMNAMIMHAGDFKSEETSVYTTPMFIKMGLIPKEMIRKNSTYDIYDVFGNQIYTTYESEAMADTFYLTFNIDKSEQSMAVCRNFFIVAKEYHEQLYMLESLSGYGTSDSLSKYYMGDKYCTSSTQCIRNLTLSKIDDMCSMHINKKGSHVKLRVK